MYGKHDTVARHLGVSLFSVILLPLALSCDSDRTMRDIAGHYANIISPLLKYRENNITGSLETEHFTCKDKEISICAEHNERQFIFNVTCGHHRLIRIYKLEDLANEILGSLDCSCPAKQRTKFQSRHRCHRRRNGNPGAESGKEKKTGEETAGGTEGRLERKDTGKEVNKEKRQGCEKKNRSACPDDRKRRRTRRRLCRLKFFFDSLKLCYMSLMERYGGQT